MAVIGYWLSSEEHKPADLVSNALRAEEVGFEHAMISDHYHPWTDKQGQGPFVWSVIGGIASVTKRLSIGTGVTCPTIRTHPAIIAQAAATAASMMEGRFFLGVGTGENLNEHIIGERWPPYAVRLEMLEEAIEVMRLLWQGGLKSHRGKYYTVDNARVYTLPEQPVPIMFAASGPKSADAAGRLADGLVATSPDKELVQNFDKAGGAGKPKHGQFTLCWAATKEEALRTAYEIWPTSGLKGPLGQELPLPQHFEAASEMVTPDDIAESTVLGPDPEPYLKRIREYEQAGFTHVYLHQIGHDQEGFFQFWQKELQPRLKSNR
jgi:coenzyme F420-dependent glucose-6-phosphate dehydrogenase